MSLDQRKPQESEPLYFRGKMTGDRCQHENKQGAVTLGWMEASFGQMAKRKIKGEGR